MMPDEYSIMPNHFHAIIINVGVDLRVCPDPDSLQSGASPQLGEPVNSNRGEHIGSPLPKVVQWFKTMTTNEYIRGVKQSDWEPFPKKLWQRNYFEHIIRNEDDLNCIRQYIRDNPMQWALDRENPLAIQNNARPTFKPLTNNLDPWMV
jgi:putative transposase